MPVMLTRIVTQEGEKFDLPVEATNQSSCVKKAVENAETTRGAALGTFVLLAASLDGNGGTDFTSLIDAFDEQEAKAREAFEASGGEPDVAEETEG